MDPTTTFCPNRNCPARGQTGMGNIGIHSQKEQRFICHECHKTFSATKGTVFYRLRTAAETVSLVVTLLAHGCPVQAIVAAFGFDERTVADWWARSGRQGQAVGFDHGVGHPLLLLYDAKTPRGKNIKDFNGLGDSPFNVSTSLF